MSKTTVTRPKRKISALALKEREELAVMLNSKVFQKALANLAACKPGVFLPAADDTENPAASVHACNNRLFEIRGWELFETGLFAQVEDPRVAREQAKIDYQSE